MLTVISPAKTLDYETPTITQQATQPQFLERAAALVADAKKMNTEEIQNLMSVSQNIASINQQRFKNWTTPFNLDNSKQSILAFKGDVYTGLDAETLNTADLNFAQNHLRILSGLYGVLRPLDLMQPYRLEMGLQFKNQGGKNLYEFWGNAITGALNKELAHLKSSLLINLASNEYFKSVQKSDLNADIVTPVFKDLKGGKYKIIAFYAKKARGLMARYIIENRLTKPDDLKNFDINGYHFNEFESNPNEIVFTRDIAPSTGKANPV